MIDIDGTNLKHLEEKSILCENSTRLEICFLLCDFNLRFLSNNTRIYLLYQLLLLCFIIFMCSTNFIVFTFILINF